VTLNNIVTLKSRSFDISSLDRVHTSSTVTKALSCIISEIKPDVCRKVRFFNTISAFDAPLRGSS